ncbi:DUF2946 family protein [Xanthomonas campestris pv. phormiicola]|nr:DUF2946 family protein [Xanthomonas campestris pv. phormiicola]UYC17351.1 DUF2946 family protein [Xanthomonas campestris pv. phormiicola]
MLAVVAIVLMLAAPLVSRWQQARSGAAAEAVAGAMCTSRGLQALPLLPIATAALHAGMHDDGAGMPHEQACDYCVLAARLLPWLALLLVLLPWVRQHAPRVAPRMLAVRTANWRAHAARGPPLYS